MGVDLANIRMKNLESGLIKILTDSQPLIETTTYLQLLLALRRRKLQRFSHNFLDDGGQQP